MRKLSLIFLFAALLSFFVFFSGVPSEAYLSPSNPEVLTWDPLQTALMPASYLGDYVATPDPAYVIGPGKVPDYLTSPNWAYSPLMRKFVDTLPGIPGVTTYNTGLGYSGGLNNLGQAMPLAVPDIVTYPGSDYYVIKLKQYTEQMHSDLANPTTLRGYVQMNNGTDTSGGCADPAVNPTDPSNCTLSNNTVAPPAIPHYLGPLIIAQKDRPVRVLFINDLPTGTGGNLFVPVDTTIMGAGSFDVDYDPKTKEYPVANKTGDFTQNRATLHLHGGKSPWISDGTPHQWITPALESTLYPEGVSVENVPDMPDPGPGAQTFYWTNQQSSRLMFYHDHAWGITRLNVYVGEAAGYMIQDPTEIDLITRNIIPAEQIPLVFEDKTFVDGNPASPSYVRATDPTWNWGTGTPDVNGIRPPVSGDLWWPHVYSPAQNPFDITGIAPLGRWAYGPYFYPATDNYYQPVPNPYFNIDCDPYYDPTPGDGVLTELDIADNEANISGYKTILGAPFCQAPEIPGTPDPSWGAEAFMDTQTVNGTVYPVLTVEPKAYRFRMLNASHDRFLSLSLYKADTALDPNTPIADDPLTEIDESLTAVSAPLCAAFGGCATESDIRMLPATVHAGFPATWPIDGRAGGVPDWSMRGPDWIMIGSEGGFLPQPVIIPPHPTTWNTNPSMFNVGNINGGSLVLGPAERADVIVDFSAYAGQTLIVYNDGSAPWPALNPQYDFYTGNPDGRPSGSADITLPGFGPNTRTVMQIKVAGTPSAPFDVTPTGPLFSEFTSQSNHGGQQSVFQRGQDPIIVAQGNMNPKSDPLYFEAFLFDHDYSAYNKAYDATFPTTYPNWGLSRINDKKINFVDTTYVRSNPLTGGSYRAPNTALTLKNKAIHDEMGATFDMLGRMRAGLGLELNATTQQVNFVVQTYSDPATEIIKPNEIQLWKISHNGVDTHPVHFHLYDVQVVNRVGWDGFIRLPDPTELGWKDTVRMSPLEDTIVALKPSKPIVPFPLPDSVRPLNPATPIGDATELSPIDPYTGNAWAVPNVNRMDNFGWEYVWHCHILSHEENDMMRAQKFQVPPDAPSNLVAIALDSDTVQLGWIDNAASETGFNLQRDTDSGFPSPTVFVVGPSVPNTTYGAVISFTDDPLPVPDITYYYRVQAFSTNGISEWSNIATNNPAPIALVSPSTLSFGNQLLNTTSAPQIVTLSNVGTADLLISSIAITGANAGDFASVDNCISPLAGGGANCSISVTFTPTTMAGLAAGLTITTNDPVVPVLTVILSGTGIAPIIGAAPSPLPAFAVQLVNTTSSAKTITVSNTGNAQLIINSISFSGANTGDFAVAGSSTCGATVAPAANCKIDVMFTPADAGSRTADLDISSSDPVNPLLMVPVSGTGTSVSINTNSLTYADQLVNTNSTAQSVTLSNTGPSALTISGIVFSGTNAGEFAVAGSSTCGATLAAAASCNIDVTFTPAASGSRSASMSINNSDPANPALTVTLNGTCISPVAGVTPATLTYANQLVNTTSLFQTATLSNTGTAPLTISSIGITGTNAGDFAISGSTCGATLAISASCNVNVTFRPTGSGASAASLTIIANDPINPTLTVGLTGMGTAVRMSTDQLLFGAQRVGTGSAIQILTMSNLGASTLTISGVTLTGTNATDFLLRNRCGTSLGAGLSCNIDVMFRPTALGVRIAAISVSNSDPTSPQIVSLSGTGIMGPVAGLSPTSLSFGNVPFGTMSGPKAITLTNIGDAPLIISSVTRGGSYSFVVMNHCPIGGAGLAPAASCTIDVTFTPIIRRITLTGSVVIIDNAGGGLQTVPLSGRGI